MSMSRISPMIRLEKIARLTIPVVFALADFSSSGAADGSAAAGSDRSDMGREYGASGEKFQVALGKLAFSRSSAEAIHNGHAQSFVGDRFGDDFIRTRLVQLAKAEKESHGGFG